MSAISQAVLLRSNCTLFALTTLVLVGRIVIHVTKGGKFQLTDFFLYLAFALYVTVLVCYIVTTPAIYRVYAVIGQEMEPYPTMLQDVVQMLRLLSGAQMSFYTLLYAVKFSLLSLYRNLLEGLPRKYRRIWWSIVGFCIVAWLGSIASTLTTCNDIKAQYSTGTCGRTPNEMQRVIFSLYFAYGLDVTTDITVMLLPLRLVWHLQLRMRQKIGIVALFASGLICVVFATLRLIELGVKHGKTTVPQPKWLMLWTIIETSVAIMIGCGPTFAVLLRKQINTKRPSCQVSSGNFKMKSVVSTPARMKRSSNSYWEVEHSRGSSQEELAKDADRIVVTTTLRQDNVSARGSSQL